MLYSFKNKIKNPVHDRIKRLKIIDILRILIELRYNLQNNNLPRKCIISLLCMYLFLKNQNQYILYHGMHLNMNILIIIYIQKRQYAKYELVYSVAITCYH